SWPTPPPRAATSARRSRISAAATISTPASRSPRSSTAWKHKAFRASFAPEEPRHLYFPAMAFEALPERLAQVRAEIARVAQHSGNVTIVAVTKGFGADAIRAARAAGVADIGENRVQEAVQKQDAVRDLTGIRWHLIGHLQRNKARLVPGRF